MPPRLPPLPAAEGLFRDLLRRHSLCPPPPPNHLDRSLSLLLASSPSPLGPSSVLSILRHPPPSADPLLLLRFFLWASLQPPLRPSPASCSAASLLLNPIHIHRLLAALPSPSLRTFRLLLDLCRHARLPDTALSVLSHMRQLNCRPDTACYNAVLRLVTGRGDELPRRIFEEMTLSGVRPDAVTYVALVKGYCSAGKFSEARVLVAGMHAHGCSPGVVVYSALLDGACRCGELDAAVELLGEMERGEVGVQPNVVTYTCLIQCLSESGRVDESLKVLDRMIARGCSPNRTTISTLLRALCRMGRITEAYGLVERLVSVGSLSSEDCYSALVVCLLGCGDSEEARKLARRIVESGMGLDKLSRNSLVRYLCSNGLFMEGFSCVDMFLKAGLELDSDVYPVLANGLYGGGHCADAASVVRWAHERRVHIGFSFPDAPSKLVD